MKVDTAKIRELRKERGFNLSEFARKVQLSVSYMSEIEHGRTNPSLGTIDKIAAALNVDRSQLLEASELGLGNKIRLARENKKMTMAETAEAAGISTSYLSEIERGSVKPSIATTKRLAEVLDVSISKLVGENVGLGAKLRRLREEQGLTQAQLAKNAGVSAGLIGQIEHGKVQPSLQTIENISCVLGVSPCYLILSDAESEGMVQQMSPDLRELLCDEKVQSVLRLLCNCNERELRFLLNFIKLYKKEGAAVD